MSGAKNLAVKVLIALFNRELWCLDEGNSAVGLLTAHENWDRTIYLRAYVFARHLRKIGNAQVKTYKATRFREGYMGTDLHKETQLSRSGDQYFNLPFHQDVPASRHDYLDGTLRSGTQLSTSAACAAFMY